MNNAASPTRFVDTQGEEAFLGALTRGRSPKTATYESKDSRPHASKVARAHFLTSSQAGKFCTTRIRERA